MDLSSKVVFVDYEGTLSQNPVGTNIKEGVTLNDLLFQDVFGNLKPINHMQLLLSQVNPKNLYVVGIIDTNKEIEQKYKWLQTNYPFIIKENIIFVSSEHKKVDVINEYVKELHIKKENIIFIDDKSSHLIPAEQQGYNCHNVNELKNIADNIKRA